MLFTTIGHLFPAVLWVSAIISIGNPYFFNFNYLNLKTMSENLSSNAVIYALLALNGEVSIQRDYLESGEVPADERDEEEETLADLEQAFMEFVDLYKSRSRQDDQLPSLDDLLNSQA
jgi:hypothetical protein